MITRRNERWWLAAAAIGVAATAGWAFWQGAEVRRVRALVATPVQRSADFSAGPALVVNEPSAVWAEPAAQSSGPDWIYDLFSPPEIYYNRATRTFSVRWEPPAPPGPPPPFGVELVSVRIDPYRLQLVGYVGSEAALRGTFENALTQETFLARAGRALPDLSLVIETVELRRETFAGEDGSQVRERIAVARVRDTTNGDVVELTTHARKFQGAPLVTLVPSGGGDVIETREGGVVEVGGQRFTIDRVDLAAGTAVVTRGGTDAPETRTLQTTAPAAH